MVIELKAQETTLVETGWLIATSTTGTYRAEVPHDLLDDEGHILDQMISFVFDTLQGESLDLRVTPHRALKEGVL